MLGHHFLGGEKLTVDRLNTGELATFAAITANATAVNSTTEQAIITTPSVKLKTGRAYRFELRGLIQHATASATDVVVFRLWRTAHTTGTIIRTLGDIAVYNGTSANRNNVVDLSHIGANDTGADINDVIVASYVWDVGSTRTFTFAASAASPGTLAIYDIGPSSAYPGIDPVT